MFLVDKNSLVFTLYTFVAFHLSFYSSKHSTGIYVFFSHALGIYSPNTDMRTVAMSILLSVE